MENTHQPLPWWFPPLALWLFLLHGLFLLADPAGWLADPGVGWHLKSGELLLASGKLAIEDPFSYTRPGVIWINYQWGFHVFVGLLEKMWGLKAVVVGCSFLYALAPVLLVRRMICGGVGVWTASILGLGVWMVMMQHTYARPHLFTYLFFGLFVALLEKFGRGEGGKGWRVLVLLPVMMLFWCNLHGGFTAGLALVGIHAGAGVWDAVRKRGDRERRRALSLASVFGACVLASLINPYGWKLHQHIWDFLGREGTARMHEFLPVWHHHSVSVVVFYLFVAAWLVMFGKRAGRMSLAESAAGCFFLFYAVSSVRHIVLFVLLAAPLLARWAGLGQGSGMAQHKPVGGETRAFAVWTVAFLLIWCALPLVSPKDWPHDLVGPNLGPASARVLDEMGGELAPIFNSDHVGGALIHRYHPDVKVFMDDRTDFYDGEFLYGVYLATLEAGEGWRERLDLYAVRGVVIKPGTPLGRKLRTEPGWKLLVEERQSEVFQRVGQVEAFAPDRRTSVLPGVGR
jgi:hypothetical protein